MEGGKPENPAKNPRSKARTNNKHNPHGYGKRTQVTEVGLGRALIHCANHAPMLLLFHERILLIHKNKLSIRRSISIGNRMNLLVHFGIYEHERCFESSQNCTSRNLFMHSSLTNQKLGYLLSIFVGVSSFSPSSE